MKEELLLNKEMSWFMTQTYERGDRPKSAMTYVSDNEDDGVRVCITVEFDNEICGQDAIKGPFTKFRGELYGIDEREEE